MFPVPEESPACYVRDLRICIGVVRGRANPVFVWVWKVYAVVGAFTLEATSVRNLFGPQYLRGYSRAGPGYYGASAEPGRSVTVEFPYRGDWRDSDGGFCGKLIIRGGCVDPDVVNMLEIPSELRF